MLDEGLKSGKLDPLPFCSDLTPLSQLAMFSEVLFGLWECSEVRGSLAPDWNC